MHNSSFASNGTYTAVSDTGVTTRYLTEQQRMTFNVVNGSARGDRKNPTAISFTRASEKIRHGTAYWYTGSPSSSYHYSGILGTYCTQGLGTWHNSELTAAYNKAYSKLSDNIRGDVDLSIDLAQMNKTMRIGHDVSNIVRSFSKFRSLNPINLIKPVSNAWLTWIYGIKPTLGSIYGAVEFCRRHYVNKGVRFRAFASNRRKDVINVDGWPDYTYSSVAETDCSYRCEISVVMAIPDNATTGAARLSSLNPVSIGWELMPYSFVADWFINIGGYLRDLETSLIYGQYFHSGYCTTTYRERAVQNAVRKSAYRPSNGLLSSEGEWIGKNRTILTAYPQPHFPSFRPVLGSGRLLNAAALLGQFLRK